MSAELGRSRIRRPLRQTIGLTAAVGIATVSMVGCGDKGGPSTVDKVQGVGGDMGHAAAAEAGDAAQKGYDLGKTLLDAWVKPDGNRRQDVGYRIYDTEGVHNGVNKDSSSPIVIPDTGRSVEFCRIATDSACGGLKVDGQQLDSYSKADIKASFKSPYQDGHFDVFSPTGGKDSLNTLKPITKDDYNKAIAAGQKTVNVGTIGGENININFVKNPDPTSHESELNVLIGK